ncbi:Protein CL16A, partial [Halocaridina rubra]
MNGGGCKHIGAVLLWLNAFSDPVLVPSDSCILPLNYRDYLLSNNHVNSIIVHKFDFSDEEVMAYYISFLKTLSLKLNIHTIHFFYNEHTNDFPLYTEAIKFFNHPESMVRIAVRTLSLNVYRVNDQSMLQFICDRTAAPYFSNLVWFIGNHILEVDNCVRGDV